MTKYLCNHGLSITWPWSSYPLVYFFLDLHITGYKQRNNMYDVAFHIEGDMYPESRVYE